MGGGEALVGSTRTDSHLRACNASPQLKDGDEPTAGGGAYRWRDTGTAMGSLMAADPHWQSD